MSLLQVTTLPFKFESYILINVAGAGVLYDFHYCTPRHDLGKVRTSRKVICLAKNYLPIFAFRLSTELTYQMRIILASDKTSKFWKTRKTTFNHQLSDITGKLQREPGGRRMRRMVEICIFVTFRYSKCTRQCLLFRHHLVVDICNNLQKRLRPARKTGILCSMSNFAPANTSAISILVTSATY